MTDVRGHVVRFSDLAASPWRNGGGVTYQVTSVPDGLAEFDWRLSIARIDADGAFSTFEGVDRHLVLATEHPLDLEMTGTGIESTVHRLQRGDAVAFPGDAQVTARVSAPGAIVVNVMSRRAVCSSGVQVLRRDATAPHGSPGVVAIVDLATLDTLLVEGGLLLDDGQIAEDGRGPDAVPGAAGRIEITRHVASPDRTLS